MATLQERIKSRRQELGFTLLEMADLLGVKEATMQRYESGEIKNIKHDTIVAIAKILRCTPQYLMGWSDLMYEPKSVQDMNLFLHSALFQKDSDIWAAKIIDNYELLSEQGKKKLLDYSNDLVSSGNYSNSTKPVTVIQAARTPDNRASVEITQMTEKELSIFDKIPQSDDDI